MRDWWQLVKQQLLWVITRLQMLWTVVQRDAPYRSWIVKHQLLLTLSRSLASAVKTRFFVACEATLVTELTGSGYLRASCL